MARLHRNHSSAFKAKVALTAIKGDLTVAEISSKFKIHSSQIAKWKKQLLESATGAFSSTKRKEASREDIADELYQEIGKLKVENEWLKKKADIMF
jgi:putative transposase